MKVKSNNIEPLREVLSKRVFKRLEELVPLIQNKFGLYFFNIVGRNYQKDLEGLFTCTILINEKAFIHLEQYPSNVYQEELSVITEFRTYKIFGDTIFEKDLEIARSILDN